MRPVVLRTVLFLLAVCASVLCPAGHYALSSSSGGTYHTTRSWGQETFAFGGGATWNGGVYQGGIIFNANNPDQITSGGTLTTTLQWIESYPNEPLPKSVAIVEELSVDAAAALTGSAGVTPDPNFAGTVSSHEDPPTVAGASRSYHYEAKRVTVLPGASTLTFGRTAYASASSPGSARAFVKYSVVAQPIKIGVNYDYNVAPATVKIGTKVLGNVYVDSLNSHTNHYATFSNVNWTIPGARIKNYIVEGGWNATGGSSFLAPKYGRKIELTAADLTNKMALSWYWWRADTHELSCEGSITIDGQVFPFQTSLEVVAVEPDFDPIEIEVSADPNGYKSTFYAEFPSAPDLPVYRISSLDRTFTIGSQPACRFFAKVASPSALSMASDRWFYQQLVRRRDTRVYKHKTTGELVTLGDPINTIVDKLHYKLDGSYRYGSKNGNQGPDYAVDSGEAVPNDTPTTSALIDYPSSPDYEFWSLSVEFHAEMYIMYRPSGVDSIPVPLDVREWRWKANETSPLTTLDYPDSSSLVAFPPSLNIKLPIWEAVLPIRTQ